MLKAGTTLWCSRILLVLLRERAQIAGGRRPAEVSRREYRKRLCSFGSARKHVGVPCADVVRDYGLLLVDGEVDRFHIFPLERWCSQLG